MSLKISNSFLSGTALRTDTYCSERRAVAERERAKYIQEEPYQNRHGSSLLLQVIAIF